MIACCRILSIWLVLGPGPPQGDRRCGLWCSEKPLTAAKKARPPPTKEAFAAMDQFTEELVKAGIMVAGAGLQNNAQAKRITSDGSSSKVIDGPFAETRELVAGFMIWQVKDMDEAVAWAKRNPMLGPSGVEIRPFYEAADLAEYLTPEELSTPRDGERGKLGVA